MSQTTPALNLTALFNGFQPLFQALRPEDVNKLAFNLVKVLQGEGGTIQEMLANTASLTNTLADRDELIGEVITNLNALMVTVDDHHEELNDLIKALRSWFGDLAEDREGHRRLAGQHLRALRDHGRPPDPLPSAAEEGRGRAASCCSSS